MGDFPKLVLMRFRSGVSIAMRGPNVILPRFGNSRPSLLCTLGVANAQGSRLVCNLREGG